MAHYIALLFLLKNNPKIENLAGFATGFEILKINQKEGGGKKKKTYPPIRFQKISTFNKK